MIIRQVRLKNIRNHEDTVVDFGMGKYAIVGETGSGKSSIRYGIEFGLFGECRGVSREALVRANAQTAEVVIVFEHKGKTYTVKRSLSRSGGKISKSTAEIYEGNTKIESGVKKVNDFIVETIGYNIDTFVVVNPPQGEIRSILKLSPTERANLVDSILGIGRFREAYEKMRGVLEPIKSKMDSLSGEISVLKGLVDAVDEAALEKEQTALEKQLLELQQKIAILKSEADALEQRKKQIEEEQKQILLAKQIQSDYNSAKQALEMISTQVNEELKKQQDIMQAIREANEKKEQLQAKKNSIDIVAVEEAYAAARRATEACMASIARLQEMQRLLVAYADKIRDMSTCPVCFKPILTGEVETISRRLSDEIESINRQVLSKQQELSNLVATERSLLTKKEQLQGELAAIDATINLLLQSIASKNDELQQSTARVQALGKSKEEKEKALEQLSKELSEKAHILARADAIQQDYSTVSDMLLKKREEIAKVSGCATLVESRLNTIRQSLDSHRRNKKNLEDRMKLLNKVSALHDELLAVRKLMQDITPYVRAYFVAALRSELKNLFTFVGQAIKYSNIDITPDDYMPIVERDVPRLAIDTSGGESLLISILFRLALARLLTKGLAGTEIECLILDEPSEMGLGDAAVNALIDLLDAVKMPQLIIITYNADVRRAVNKVYEVVAGPSGVAEVVRPA